MSKSKINSAEQSAPIQNQKKTFFQLALPNIISLAVMLLVLSLYFGDIVFKGKIVEQHDIIQATGMTKEIVDFRKEHHQEPLWTNSMFGGMPAFQISVNYAGNFLRYINKFLLTVIPYPVSLLFIVMAGFYLLSITMGVNTYLSLAGALAYGFASYFFGLIEAGHNSKLHALGFVAPVLASLVMSFNGKRVLGSLLLAIFLSLHLQANHVQITYYLLMMIVAFGAVEFIFSLREKRIIEYLKTLAFLSAAALIAVTSNAGLLWSTYSYGKYTMRGKSELTRSAVNEDKKSTGLEYDYATAWSYGTEELLTLLIPNASGGSSDTQGEKTKGPTYWGAQPFTSVPVYAGAVAVFLFVLGMFVVKGKIKWWLLIVTVLSLGLSLGHNFRSLTDFFFYHVPAYNKFRAVAMILVIAELTIPLLGILALREIVKGAWDKKELLKKLYWSVALTAGLCALLWLMGSGIFDFSYYRDDELKQTLIKQYKASSEQADSFLTTLREDRLELFKADALRSLFFILLAAAGIWAYIRGMLKLNWLAPLLALIILIDMWGVDRRYLHKEKFVRKNEYEQIFYPREADSFILQDKDYYRVFALDRNPFNDAVTSYFHKSVGGYHGAKLKRYQELIDAHLSQLHFSVINMLNTRYLIFSDPTPVPGLQMVFAGKQDKEYVYKNLSAYGPCWFVREVKVKEIPDDVLESLDKEDLLQTALIEKKDGEFLKDYSKDSLDVNEKISLTVYQPNHLKYSSESDKNRFAIFSEIYYSDGWTATIDGRESHIFHVNYVLRGLIVPAGKHTIEFIFEPKSFRTGELVAKISSSLVILLCIGFIYFSWRNKSVSSVN